MSNVPLFLSLEKEVIKLGSPKQEAFKKLLISGLPSKQNEDWKYTSLRDIENFEVKGLSQTKPSEAELKSFFVVGAINLLWIDGIFQKALSQALPQTVTLSLQEEPAGLENKTDFFESLNQVFTKERTELSIEKKSKNSIPFNLIFLVVNNFSTTSVSIKAGSESESTWFSHHAEWGQSSKLTTSNLQITLEANAHLSHQHLEASQAQSQHFFNSQVTLNRDAQFKSFLSTTGSKLSRHNLKVSFVGENGNASLSGLYVLEGNNHHDLFLDIHHAVPQCTSSQLYRGLLNGQSHGVFTGKVLVDKHATGTLSSQLNQNLLLSKDCTVDTRPQLEILHNDVKCSHGATIGRLNEKEIFYLQSRGVPRPLAEQILSLGFIRSLLEVEAHPLFKATTMKQLREHTVVGATL